MFYKILLTSTLFLTLTNADSFQQLAPTPTEQINKIIDTAQPCSFPIKASHKLTDNFKYGCFCGKEYPKLDSNRTEDFKKLTKDERYHEILKLYSIKPFDDIDKTCQEHDICYLYYGKKAKVCNDAIYDNLSNLSDVFKINQTLEDEQCSNLSLDMASVFKTFFAMADDEDSIFDIGMLMVTTGMIAGNKAMQESVDIVTRSEERYPKRGQQCLLNK